MQVKSSEFEGRYAGLTVLSNNDSGLFAVQYSEKGTINAAQVKRLHNDWYDSQAYTMEITFTVPAPRTVLRSLIVVKSSANCYRVGYADSLGCAQFVVKTYDELHDQLSPLWARK